MSFWRIVLLRKVILMGIDGAALNVIAPLSRKEQFQISAESWLKDYLLVFLFA